MCEKHAEYRVITKIYNNTIEKGRAFVSIINTINRDKGKIYETFLSEQNNKVPFDVNGIITVIYEVYN